MIRPRIKLWTVQQNEMLVTDTVCSACQKYLISVHVSDNCVFNSINLPPADVGPWNPASKFPQYGLSLWGGATAKTVKSIWRIFLIWHLMTISLTATRLSKTTMRNRQHTRYSIDITRCGSVQFWPGVCVFAQTRGVGHVTNVEISPRSQGLVWEFWSHWHQWSGVEDKKWGGKWVIDRLRDEGTVCVSAQDKLYHKLYPNQYSWKFLQTWHWHWDWNHEYRKQVHNWQKGNKIWTPQCQEDDPCKSCKSCPLHPLQHNSLEQSFFMKGASEYRIWNLKSKKFMGWSPRLLT